MTEEQAIELIDAALKREAASYYMDIDADQLRQFAEAAWDEIKAIALENPAQICPNPKDHTRDATLSYLSRLGLA